MQTVWGFGVLSFQNFEKAIESLNDSIDPPWRNDRERDGSIQRFEFTFELMWKTGKRVLADHGIEALSPKAVIREMAAQGWIESPEKFMQYQQARTSHVYLESVAVWVAKQIPDFLTDVKGLLQKFKSL